jgi:hypothetical protein
MRDQPRKPAARAAANYKTFTPSTLQGIISYPVSHALSSVDLSATLIANGHGGARPGAGRPVGSQRCVASAYLLAVNHLVVGSSPANGGIAIRIHEEEPVTKMTEVAA